MRCSILLLAALSACGSRSTRPDDASVRPGDAPADRDAAPLDDAPGASDAAPPSDGTLSDGTLPDGTLPDGMAPLDASLLVDGAPQPDAAGDAMAQPDAGSPTPNTVSCYTEGAPATTCTLPTHCCFTNYSAQHDGTCTTAACVWGTITCDGPEDCSGGQRCCAHALIDPTQGLTGYAIGCQAGPCGAAPANQELCHAGTCSTGTCVSAFGVDNDLPRSLNICQ